MLSLYANITLDKTGKQKTRVVLSFLPELVKITPFVSSSVASCAMIECCHVDDTSPERAVTGLSPG